MDKGHRAGITDRGVESPPVVVVEVLPPSSRTLDREKKPHRYLEFGVPAYWAVDPTERVVWVWDRETGPDAPRRVEGTLRWTFPEGSEPLEVEVSELVAPL